MEQLLLDGEDDKFKETPRRECRQERRYLCPLATILFVQRMGDTTAGEEAVWLTNLAKNGLAFCCDRPLPCGEGLTLRLASLGPQSPPRQAWIVHATQQLSGNWVIGCRLDSPLTDEDLDRVLGFSTSDQK